MGKCDNCSCLSHLKATVSCSWHLLVDTFYYLSLLLFCFSSNWIMQQRLLILEILLVVKLWHAIFDHYTLQQIFKCRRKGNFKTFLYNNHLGFCFVCTCLSNSQQLGWYGWPAIYFPFIGSGGIAFLLFLQKK